MSAVTVLVPGASRLAMRHAANELLLVAARMTEAAGLPLIPRETAVTIRQDLSLQSGLFMAATTELARLQVLEQLLACPPDGN